MNSEPPRGHTLFTFIVTLPDSTQGFLQVRADMDGSSEESYKHALCTAYRLCDGCAKIEPHSSTFMFERIPPDV